MMRKALAFLLLPLILMIAGCHQGDVHPTLDDTGTPSTQLPSITDTRPMQELYISNSILEDKTKGAVLCYEAETGTNKSLIPFADDLLLVSTAPNSSYIVLTRITGEKGGVKQQVQISCNPEQFLRSLRVSFESLGYYDENNGCIIFLNGQLQETRRLVLPSNRVGNPIISSDLSKIYYTTETQIRAIDSQTEVSRLLREHSYPLLRLDCTCFKDEQLLCHVTEVDGDEYVAFVSTVNGAITAVDAQMLSFVGKDSSYFLMRKEGSVNEYLFGEYGQNVHEFLPKLDGNSFWIPETSKVAVIYSVADNTVTIDSYDLFSGQLTASITLPDISSCYSVVAGSDEGVVWFLARDTINHCDYLCRWDMSCNSVANASKYTSIYYTSDNPDADGLGNCKQLASSLRDLYSIDLVFDGRDMIIPQEYSFETEHKVRAIETSIASLENILFKFPNGFFELLAQSMEDDTLYIQLVRSISDQPGSLQNWNDGNSYITLEIGMSMELSFYYALYHTMESFLFANSGYLDNWNTHNPGNFEYLYNYSGYESLNDSKYLTEEHRTFIDAYSMTYPTEDRAKIFAYAMMEGNEDLFSTKMMQGKLSLLCTAIRDAFNLNQDTKLPWEMYLK